MMKRCAWIVLIGMWAICLSVSSLHAQEKDLVPKQMLADLKERLALTDDQIAQIRPILKEQGEAIRGLIEQYKGSGFLELRSLQQEIQQLRQDMLTTLEPIVTVTQMKELQAFQDEIRTHIQSKVAERIIMNVAEQLDLSEEQIEQFAPLMKSDLDKRRDLIEQYRGQGRRAWKSFREENRQIRQETEQELESILTVEQMKAYKALQNEFRQKIRQEILKRRQNVKE